MVADETSKAFRASIGRLRDHEIKLLHRWALQHCAMCAVLCGSKGTIVLVALKDTARTAASFARTIRAAMRSLGIPTSKALAGHWQRKRSHCEASLEQDSNGHAQSGDARNHSQLLESSGCSFIEAGGER